MTEEERENKEKADPETLEIVDAKDETANEPSKLRYLVIAGVVTLLALAAVIYWLRDKPAAAAAPETAEKKEEVVVSAKSLRRKKTPSPRSRVPSARSSRLSNPPYPRASRHRFGRWAC